VQQLSKTLATLCTKLRMAPQSRMHQYTAAKRADTYKPNAYDLMRVDENWGIK
jgi:hypothetical protein